MHSINLFLITLYLNNVKHVNEDILYISCLEPILDHEYSLPIIHFILGWEQHLLILSNLKGGYKLNLVLVGLFGAISVGFRSQFCSVNGKDFGVGGFEDGWLMVV